MFWDQHYAQRTHDMKSSAIRELLKVTELPEVISFAGGLPAPEVFPVEEVRATTQQVLQEQGVQALQYGPKVAFVPGTDFHANGGGENTMRLSFLNASPEKIREGIARLGKLLAARPAKHIA